MSTVKVASRLPWGLVLEHPSIPGKSAVLNGINTSLIINAPYNVTDIDKELWDAWAEHNPNFPALANNIIFQGDSKSISSWAGEVEDEKTGLEAMEKSSGGVTPSDGE